MAVAHDAITESATWTSGSPHTFDHTPSGTPRGVVLLVGGYSSAAHLNSLPTYGGVTMRKVGEIADLAGEDARVYAFFLGESVPTGTQTVSIGFTGTATKWAAVATVTASADTEVGSVAVSSQDLASNATTTPNLYKGPTSGLAYAITFNGAALTNLTLAAGMTDLNVEDEQSGTMCMRVDVETSPSSGLVTNLGWTQGAADDHATIILNVQEVVSGPRIQGSYRTLHTTPTTSVTHRMQGDLDGKDLFVFALSRNSTSASSDVTCTDDSGGNSWTSVGNDADKKLWVFWKRGVAADVGALLTIDNAVNSVTFSMLSLADTDGAGGNPVTDLDTETNASADETHAGFTPTNAGSVVLFAVGDYGNDTNAITNLAGATMGSLEPEWVESLSTGGSDCRLTVTGRTLASGGTGSFTWTQGNSTTKSVAFAVTPAAGGTPGTASPAVTSITLTVPGSAPAGAAVSTPAASTVSLAVPAVSAFDSGAAGSTTPAVSSVALGVPAVTPRGAAAATPPVLSSGLTVPPVTLVIPTSVTPAATVVAVTVPAATRAGAAVTNPAATLAALSIPAATAAGFGAVTPTATSIALTVPPVVLVGGGVATPTVLDVALTVPQVTILAGGAGSTSPAQIAVALAILQATAKGATTVSPAAVASAINIPQVTPVGPAIVAAGMFDIGLTLLQVTVDDGLVVVTYRRVSASQTAGRQSPQQRIAAQAASDAAGGQSPHVRAGRQSPLTTVGRQSGDTN